MENELISEKINNFVIFWMKIVFCTEKFGEYIFAEKLNWNLVNCKDFQKSLYFG